MLNDQNIVVVMPAYNAEETLAKTYRELPHGIVDHVILVDDASDDQTVDIARDIDIPYIVSHKTNQGYGANQKTCYQKALDLGADVVIMVHPDYQYDPRLVTAMASLISSNVFDCVMGSRILGTGALKGGMPFYKYVANRLLTGYQNILIPYKLSEYHTGYRAFSREVLETIALEQNSNDFIFDNQMLLQIIAENYLIGEVTCPTRYMHDSSSISIFRSVQYGLSVLAVTLEYKLAKWRLIHSKRFFNNRKGN
ncbi:MAG: glycosyltransferase family 2 protein [gamma proteobacterium symbiont of Taylorina sp.]|nr:glycosyltransferase family 2 protein [gamma proteobacterium symbiont of Taylorina sp.]